MQSKTIFMILKREFALTVSRLFFFSGIRETIARVTYVTLLQKERYYSNQGRLI